MKLLHRTSEQAVAGSPVLVAVAFLWPHAIIGSLRKLLIQKHSYTKSWKIREFFIFYCCYSRSNSACAIYFPHNLYIDQLLNGWSYHTCMAHDHYSEFVLKDLFTICSCVCLIIMSLLPFCPDIHIVICRRTPDVKLHWMIQIFPACILKSAEQAGTLIQPICEAITI